MAVASSLLAPDYAHADYSEWQKVERQIDWTAPVAGGRIGIAEERYIRMWSFNEFDGRIILGVRTTIHYGFGVVSVPCRLWVFVAFLATILIAALCFSSGRKRNINKQHIAR